MGRGVFSRGMPHEQAHVYCCSDTLSFPKEESGRVWPVPLQYLRLVAGASDLPSDHAANSGRIKIYKAQHLVDETENWIVDPARRIPREGIFS